MGLEMIRMGQVPTSRSRIVGDEDGLSFWLDDRVRLKKPNQIVLPFKDIPGFESGVRVVRDIRRNGDEILYSLSDRLFGGWEEVRTADGLELVSRGNVWRLRHGEGTIFRDWCEELDCHSLLGEITRVFHPGGPTVRWHVDEARRFIANGTADAFMRFFPDRPPVDVPVLRLFRFNDRALGRRISVEVLRDLG